MLDQLPFPTRRTSDLGKNAKVLYGAVDNFGPATTTYVNRRGVADDYAVLDWALGQMNEGRTVSENVSVLVGQYSKAYPKTVTVGRGRSEERRVGKEGRTRMARALSKRRRRNANRGCRAYYEDKH